MEEREKGGNSASNSGLVTDFPAKNFVRQLFGGVSTSATVAVVPQPENVVVGPVPQTVLAQTRSISVSSMRVVKSESPLVHSQPIIEAKDGTPKKHKQCNCKHSRCLKLYCECFASGVYCDGCNCNNCYNNIENEAARRDAIEATLERNPNAFRPKIASSPHGTRDSKGDSGDVVTKHNKGCHCKKSGCLKKYCECFQGNILCSDNCKCIDCKNFEGSEERRALHMQHSANAAISGFIASADFISIPNSRKRKGTELPFRPPVKDHSISRASQFQQVNIVKASGTSLIPSSFGSRAVNVTQAASKFTYKSLLADIIQPQDVKELCSVLVVLTEKAAKTIAESNNAEDLRGKDGGDSSYVSLTHERVQQSDTRSEHDGSTNENQTDRIGPDDSNLDGNNLPKSRPMSPLTLALRCDEKDTMFMATSSNGLANHVNSSSLQLPKQGTSEVYAEQERIVLTKFRDCLNRLISFGELKESKCHSLARADSMNIQGKENGTTKERGDGQTPKELLNNRVSKPVISTPLNIAPSKYIAMDTTTIPLNIVPSNTLAMDTTTKPAIPSGNHFSKTLSTGNGDVKPSI